MRLSRLTVGVGRFPPCVIGRGASEGGDDGVVVRVGVVRVVHGRVVAVVFRRSSGDADVRLADVAGTRRLEPASVVLLGGPEHAVVVVVALVAANHGRIVGRFGEGDLPLVAHVGGLGVAQNLGAFQGAAGHKAHGARAGGVVRLLAGGGDVDGELRAAGHGLGGLGAPAAHDGTGLGVVDVVVVGGRGGAAQVPIVDAGWRHGVAMRGAGRPTGARGGVRRSVHVLHLKGPLQSCTTHNTSAMREGCIRQSKTYIFHF